MCVEVGTSVTLNDVKMLGLGIPGEFVHIRRVKGNHVKTLDPWTI